MLVSGKFNDSERPAEVLMDFDRLVLYYPVSSLVTLFANILQNPQDVRARGDLRLMSSVVSFLTMLERDAAEANGNVRRMLSVCSEFERIAKVVLDKAEREMKGRGKRKQAEREKDKDKRDVNSISAALDQGKTLEMMQVETQAGYRRPIQTPSLRRSMEGSGSAQGSPGSWNGSSGVGVDQRTPGSASTASDGMLQPPQQQQQQQVQQRQQQPPSQRNSGQWNSPSGFAGPFPQQDFTSTTQPQQAPPFAQEPNIDATTTFNPLSPSALGLDMSGGFNTNLDATGSFQQPFVPQDLWQMPMTLEWDWAEGLGLGSFTPGPGWDGMDGLMGGQQQGQG